MTEQTRSALRELQRLDLEIEEARARVASFEPLLEEVEEPALALEGEVGTTRQRLQEMRVEERRLEVTAQEKRNRVKKLEERLLQVRNVREEAAVSAELDLVRQALEGDEQEALSLLDQIRKLELRLEEQDSALTRARADVEPRRQELLAQLESARDSLQAAEVKRKGFAGSVVDSELRVYESIRVGGRRRAVATLTPDGACGHCFSMVPLQIQNEIRHGASLIRCEACGVILAAPHVDEDGEEDAAGA
jgi:predicted  nucleic acid-binding Zn-ribbon protein